jgi:predicted enzyme related to lactoylglutathione lyase
MTNGERTNEDQVDQRLCGQPRKGSGLLHRGVGLTKKVDFSSGPYRWLTVASPDEPDGTELQLASNDNPAAKAYQQAIFQQGQPAVMFFTADVKGDYERIKARGAEFTIPPTEVTGSTIAQLNDTCGNLIQITQLARW